MSSLDRFGRLRRHVIRLALLSLAATRVAAAQGVAAPPAPQGPPGWKWSLDRAAHMSAGGKAIGSDSLFEFTNMAPGWHVTMGPGGVLHDPREQADHRFILSSELILFPDAALDGEYGVFVGGKAMESSAAEWVAFVVRGDGSAAVLHRVGGETRPLMPWTRHAGVKPRPAEATVTNVVQVRAEPDSIRFLVNGERVAAFARAALDVNGAFGFRIGSRVNLHVTNLDVTRRLAPYPTRR